MPTGPKGGKRFACHSQPRMGHSLDRIRLLASCRIVLTWPNDGDAFAACPLAAPNDIARGLAFAANDRARGGQAGRHPFVPIGRLQTEDIYISSRGLEAG
jgi:hypothetical protein